LTMATEPGSRFFSCAEGHSYALTNDHRLFRLPLAHNKIRNDHKSIIRGGYLCMKKQLTAVLAVVMSMGLFACRANDNATPDQAANNGSRDLRYQQNTVHRHGMNRFGHMDRATRNGIYQFQNNERNNGATRYGNSMMNGVNRLDARPIETDETETPGEATENPGQGQNQGQGQKEGNRLRGQRPTKGTGKDVDQDDWFSERVEWSFDANLIQGFPDGSFRPEKPLTRAEMIQIITNLVENGYLNIPDPEDEEGTPGEDATG